MSQKQFILSNLIALQKASADVLEAALKGTKDNDALRSAAMSGVEMTKAGAALASNADFSDTQLASTARDLKFAEERVERLNGDLVYKNGVIRDRDAELVESKKTIDSLRKLVDETRTKTLQELLQRARVTLGDGHGVSIESAATAIERAARTRETDQHYRSYPKGLGVAYRAVVQALAAIPLHSPGPVDALELSSKLETWSTSTTPSTTDMFGGPIQPCPPSTEPMIP